MSKQQKIMTGSCLCGAIKYQVDKLESHMAHCHCSMCRKFHGAAFSTFGEATSDHFKWLQGEERLKSYTAKNGSVRQFCEHCGSSMTFSASKKNTHIIEFALATLDNEIDVKPDAHVFVESKVNWIDIKDDLPKFLKERT